MYQDQITRAIRLFNIKLSKARRAIKELAIGSKVNYVPELRIESLSLECRTLVYLREYQEFNLSLKNEKFELFFTTLTSVYHSESENTVNEKLDTLFRSCTGESPMNLTEEELLNESIQAFSKSIDQYPLFYNEYDRLHPRLYQGSSISDTEYSIACRKAGLSTSGDLHDEILKHHREDVQKLVEAIKNMR